MGMKTVGYDNPLHTAKVEAELIALEALRRAAVLVRRNEDSFTSGSLSPAYRRDVANELAKMYSKALDDSGFDGMHLEILAKGNL